MTMRKERVLTGLHGRWHDATWFAAGVCGGGLRKRGFAGRNRHPRPAGGPRLFYFMPRNTHRCALRSHRRSSRSPPLRSMVGRVLCIIFTFVIGVTRKTCVAPTFTPDDGGTRTFFSLPRVPSSPSFRSQTTYYQNGILSSPPAPPLLRGSNRITTVFTIILLSC